MDPSRSTEKLSNPINWKPLVPKSANDAYFKGTKSKKCHSKKKKMSPEYVAPPQTYSVQHAWDVERVHQIMSSKPVTQQEMVEQFTEEIQYLSLQDFKVHKKRFPKKVPPVDAMWAKEDFPGIRVGADDPREDSRMAGGLINYDCRSLVSKSCQTDEILSSRDFPSRTSGSKGYESLNECVDIISVLSKYFLNCIFHSIQGGELLLKQKTLMNQGIKTVRLSTLEMERIKCIIYSEIRHFSSFNSGIPYSIRLDRFQNSFRALVEEYPMLREQPCFAGLLGDEDLWSNK